MRKPIIAIKLSPRNYAGLVNLGNRTVSSLTGNIAFASPTPALSVVQTAITAVENGIAAWSPLGNRGSHADLITLRQDALTLSQLLKALAQYVQLTAQVTAGSDYSEMATLIVSSGFQLASVPTPQGVLEMVQRFHRFSSRQLAPNQLKLKWAKPLNVTSSINVKDYRVMRGATTDFAAAVQIASTTRTSFIDSNNTNAPQTWTYWIVPFNTAGPGVPSDGITVTILNA